MFQPSYLTEIQIWLVSGYLRLRMSEKIGATQIVKTTSKILGRWTLEASSEQGFIITSFDPPNDYLLVHIIVEIHLFGILDEWSLSPSSTFTSSPWFNDEPLFRTRFHSSSLENLRCRFDNVLHLSSQASWVWVILTPIRTKSRSDMMVGTYFQEL